MPIRPATTMRIDSTPAKTGRSMKKREMFMAIPLSRDERTHPAGDAPPAGMGLLVVSGQGG
ncbi:hypothetical protein GCM10023069_18650 [Shinella granuli]